MNDQKHYESYRALLKEFLDGDREKAIVGVSDLATECADAHLGPDVLVKLHTQCLAESARREGALGPTGAALAAHEFMVAGIMAFASRFYTLMEQLEAQKKKAEQEHAQLVVEIEGRKLREEQMREGQKMEALSTLAGGIAHGFNNMLAAIMGNAELALDDLERSEPARHNVEQILKASRRGRELVKQILTFTRSTQRHEEVFGLKPLIEETLNLMRGTIPDSIEIGLSLRPETDMVRGDRVEIQQVLVNLITNATHAMLEHGGKLELTLRSVTHRERERELQPGTYLLLKVRDTGVGMERSTLRRIFDPFFTTKEPGRGAGMGLSIVYGIVKAHGGVIAAVSEPKKGSVFSVYFPVGERPTASKVSEAAHHGRRRRATVLFVDDEEAIRSTIGRILERAGYTVFVKSSGEEALKFFAGDPIQADIVITDEIMSGMRGTALARKLCGMRPELPVILLTGYDQGSLSAETDENPISERLMKPIMKQELLEAIERVTRNRGYNYRG